MSLVIVNPSPTAKRKKRKKAITPTPARKAASKGAKPMAKHRTAAQKAATRRMLAANRRHRNPAPAKRRHRLVSRNPSPVAYHRRRRTHRNPAGTGPMHKDMLNQLMSKNGLMNVAAVAGTPTVLELLMGQFAAGSTGYTRVAMKGAMGIALAYAIHKFVSKEAGLTVAYVTLGTAIAEGIQSYHSGNVLAAVSSAPVAKSEGYGRVMNGYAPTRETGIIYR